MEEYIFNLSGEEIQERLDAVPNKADKDSVYTKTETDAKLANKADKNSVYTKTETDTKFSQLEQEQIQGGIYDVSAHNNSAVFESLQALLNSPNLSTLIPISVRHGGMSIRFINSDNKYVQFRYMDTSTATADFTNINNWIENKSVEQDIAELSFIPTTTLTSSATTKNWKLRRDGLCSQDEDYQLVKYLVNEGDVLMLNIAKDSNGVIQFQSAASVPSTGINTNLVGYPYTNAVNGMIKVPVGATYLIVSQLKTTTTNVVRKKVDANSLVSVVKSLQYNIHNDNRTFTFSKTGHYIKTDGTLGDSTNWWMGNVVRLYKGETVEVFCATTERGVIIALTDLEQSFYTPVVVVVDYQVQALHKYKATEDCYIILQYWKITGSPSIYDDSERVISIENRLADVESDIEEIKASKPQYVIDETERIKRKLLSMLNGNATIFAFNTDQHFEYPCLISNSVYNPKYAMHGVNAIVDVAKEIPLDMIVLGGDVSGYDGRASNTIKGILQEVEYLNSPFMDLNVPEVSIPGNHDAFQNNGNITAQGMYNVHFKRSKWYNALHHSGSDNCDCYYDDTDKKIRYIFVDIYSRNVRTESYTTFLSNALSSMSEGYKAIIFSHKPLTNEFAGIVKTINSSGQKVDAFHDPTDLHSIINQYAENVVACICGHSHCDAWGINNSGILFIETTTAAPHTIGHTEDGIPYKKTMNSATETAFDFFVIDLDNQTIEAVRYGQGTNRKWKYKGTGQGLISYKNCVSGAVSIPSLTLTFTNSGDNTDVVNVTCDGNGFYEVYLTLGATYTITCNGYTLDVSSVEVSENKVVNITATSK